MNAADIKHGITAANLKAHLKQSIPTKPTQYKEVKDALPQVSYIIDRLYDASASVRKDVADSLFGDGTICSIERWNIAHREEAEAHDEAFAA